MTRTSPSRGDLFLGLTSFLQQRGVRLQWSGCRTPLYGSVISGVYSYDIFQSGMPQGEISGKTFPVTKRCHHRPSLFGHRGGRITESSLEKELHHVNSV